MAALWQRARQEVLPGVRAPTDPNLSSPTPSGDRLSVSIGHGGSTRSSFGSSSARYSIGGDSSDPATPTDIRGVRFSKDYLATHSHDDDDDDDYSASIDALLRRRDSKRRGSTRRSPARRVSSPYSIADSERHRRRSSTMTTTSGETQISMEDSEIPEEEIFETIHMHKEVIDGVKKQAWRTRKKLKVIRQAKIYVRKHEGLLEARLAQSKSTKDIMARYKLVFQRYWARLQRQLVNLAALMVPWEQRIKRIESHFGSVVASYFTFLRWVFWINIVMSILIACFIIIPEVLAADRIGAGDRKELLPNEEDTAFNLQTLWDFEGWLKYSPIFYGYYTNTDKTQEGYRLPFAYFLTSLGVYVYSFWAILQKMAENSRMSKLSEKDDECTFTWKLFTGWDYMIGNSETSQNKVASLVMSFKEAILEEQEKQKEGRNWKIIALRSIANFIIVLLLGSSAYAVVLVVERSQEPEGDSDWWRQNEVTVVVSMIGVLWPNLFEIVGLMENYHPRNQLQWQLSRILMLNMLNLYTLNFALFDKVDKMSLELVGLKPNTTTSAPPTTTTTYQMTPTNATGAWTLSLFNESTVMPRYINTSVGIFNLTGLDPNCTVVAYDCEVPEEDFFTTVTPLLNFTLPSDLFYTNASLLPTLSDFFTWTFGPDINSTLSTMLPNFTDFFDFNGTLPMLNDSVPFYINTSVSLLVGNATNISSSVLPSLEFGVTIHPSLKSMSRIFLPPELVAKHNLSLAGNVSLANGTEMLPVNTTELGTTLSTLVTDWISEAYFPGMVTEANVTLVVSTSATPLNSTDGEGFDVTSSIPLNFTDLFDGTMEVKQCYKIECPEFPTSDFSPSTFIPFPEMETTTPSLATFPTTVDPCANDNCTQETTTDEEHRSTPLIVDGYEVDMETRIKLRKLCWETMFGQEIVKLTIMDLVLTIVMTVITDFIRAVIVRVLNRCCCWDLEKNFPGYGDFKIAENILHLVNNQGMVWMGTFFSPGLPGINMVKLFILMYVRSWAVLTSNIPPETVFKASGSNNFYYALLLTMLFLCTLPVSYAVVWLEPSWHCGPFSQYSRIYRILTTSVTSVMPGIVNRALDYITSPSIVIPLMVLLILVIYYLLSLTQSLREANKDLKNQLRKERTEQKKQVSQMAEARHDGADTPSSKWPAVMKKILPVLPNKSKEGSELETLRQASQESKESGKEDGSKNSKVEAVKPYVLSDDESILIETDNETTSITYTDETKQDKRKSRTKSKDIYERERKMSDVPLITISKAKDFEPSEKEKNGKNKEKKDKKNKKGRSQDREEKKSKGTEDQTSDSDDQAALIKPDKKKDKDEKTKKDKKSKEKKEKEETEEKGKKDKKGKDKEKEKDSKKDKDEKSKKEKEKEEKDKKEKEKKETKKEKEERLKREKEEQKREKEEKKKREKEEKSKKDKEEKGKKDKDDKKKEKEENGKKDTDEKGKKDKDEKGKKEKDEKGKKEKDKKEKEEKGKKEKDEKDKKEKVEKGKREKEKGKKEKESKSKKDKEGKSNKDKEDEDKNEKEEKGKKKEKDKQKKDDVVKEGKDDKKKDNEKESKDKKKKEDKHIKIAEDVDHASEDDGSSLKNQNTGTKKISKRDSSEDSSKQEEIEMESIKPEKNEEQLNKQKHLQKSEGIDEEDMDEESRKKQEQMMKDAHLKGDGMFESDTVPLVADSGTPSSISSGRANRVATLDSSVDASLSEEGECDISEVTVLIQDQREPLTEEPDEDTTSLHSEKSTTAGND